VAAYRQEFECSKQEGYVPPRFDDLDYHEFAQEARETG
jgi:hypothetical protein